jgi:hypothetical protein
MHNTVVNVARFRVFCAMRGPSPPLPKREAFMHHASFTSPQEKQYHVSIIFMIQCVHKTACTSFSDMPNQNGTASVIHHVNEYNGAAVRLAGFVLSLLLFFKFSKFVMGQEVFFVERLLLLFMTRADGSSTTYTKTFF